MLCFLVTELVTASHLLQIIAQNERFGLHCFDLHFNSISNFSDTAAYVENQINEVVCSSEGQTQTEFNSRNKLKEITSPRCDNFRFKIKMYNRLESSKQYGWTTESIQTRQKQKKIAKSEIYLKQLYETN